MWKFTWITHIRPEQLDHANEGLFSNWYDRNTTNWNFETVMISFFSSRKILACISRKSHNIFVSSSSFASTYSILQGEPSPSHPIESENGRGPYSCCELASFLVTNLAWRYSNQPAGGKPVLSPTCQFAPGMLESQSTDPPRSYRDQSFPCHLVRQNGNWPQGAWDQGSYFWALCNAQEKIPKASSFPSILFTKTHQFGWVGVCQLCLDKSNPFPLRRINQLCA